MKATISCILIVLGSAILSEISAQDVFKLWEGQAKPYYKENNLKEHEKEEWGLICVYDVTEPTLTVYRAEGQNSGKAVIIIPGGGYTLESIYHEGYNLAKVLSQNGITAAVLKYRLPNPASSDQPQFVPLSDTRRALSTLRKKAEMYGIQADQVGVMGFSAGSHLATVTSLWRSDDDDDVCNVSESTLYASALYAHDVPSEMHLFPKGGHGFGMGRQEDGTDQWVPLFISWLKQSEL